MPHNTQSLLHAALAMVLLTLAVGMLMMFTRVREMQRKRIHPQSASTSVTMGAQLENVQPADNFRNLFEVPVLFYALLGMALALGQVPTWLVTGAWLFVGLRVLHSLVHCTYNKVVHRLMVFMASFALLIGLWVTFVVSVAARNAA